jgi:hypothetical protein
MFVKHKIRGLELLLKLIERQIEKQLLVKKLLRQIMLGVLTPEMVRKAKEFGLVRFLKDAITELVKRGQINPQAAASMAGVLSGEGIQMPLLDDLVIKHERAELGDINAARIARGNDPVGATAVAQAGTGASALSTSTVPEAHV